MVLHIDDGPAPLFNWIKSPEYLKLKIDERAAWHKAYGQERELNLFVAPSGSLNARLIIHLHCPSFACAENRSEECFDLSSRCLAQLQLLGFNTGNSLFVDHNPRREAHNLGTLLPITEYPPPVREVHERFMNNVRERSAAVVELCFGKAVEQRMRDLLGQRIQPLKLWGTYEGITLWLEFDRVLDGTCDTKLLRIILFVEHPSSTFWCSSQRFDLYRSTTFAAARLAGIELRTTQNLGILRCPPRHRLTPAQARESYELNRMATEDLKRLGLIKHARVAAAHEPEGCQQDHVKDLELAEVTENGILNAGEAAEAVEHAAKWATTQAHVVSESPSPGIEPRTMPGNPSARVMKSTSEKRGFGTGQRTQHPAWYVNFVRSQEECREFRIPFTILTTCVKCRKALQQGPTMMDLDARWTINTPPTYIPRQRTCGASGHEKATFVPVNIDIPIVSDSGLTTFWRKNIATGKIPLDDARRHFDQIFGPRKLWYLPWHIIKTRFATED